MRLAAIDIGSNSIHMVVAQVESDGRFRVVDRAKEMVRLGQRTFLNGSLSDQAIDAGLRTLASFRTLAERQGVSRFTAVATSAVREARNGGDFVQRVNEEVGLRVKVIPGREEARLIYLAVRHALDLRHGRFLIVDAGGGSVELIEIEDNKAVAMHSVRIGVARLAEQFLSADRLSGNDLSALEATLAEELAPIFGRLAGRPIRCVVGTSGTLLNLISIAAAQRGDAVNDQLNNLSVSAREIARVRRLVTRASREERLRIKALDHKRVDFIVVGACLAHYVLRQLRAKEMVACTWALREGLVLDFIARHLRGIEETELFADPRRRSVVRLARHIGENGTHGQQVARLALQLFDQLQGPLSLPAQTRDWLEFAALLHDIGHHIGHKDHQRHSYYLITNGELLGFRPEEVEIIGQIARYHRKAVPKASDPGYAALPRNARRSVRALSALLRVADGLDRSHYSVVREVRVSRRAKHIVLHLHTERDDSELEIWEARRRAGLLEDVLRVRIDFDTAIGMPGGASHRLKEAVE